MALGVVRIFYQNALIGVDCSFVISFLIVDATRLEKSATYVVLVLIGRRDFSVKRQSLSRVIWAMLKGVAATVNSLAG